MLARAGRLCASLHSLQPPSFLPCTSLLPCTPLISSTPLFSCTSHLHSTPHRTVTSLGPLAAAFNSKPSHLTSNFKLQWGQERTGLFGIDELSSSQGFYELKARCIEAASALVQEACSDNRTRNVAVIFDDLSDELCRVADLAEFVRLAHPEEAMQAAATDACIAISGLVEELNTHIGIYTALKRSVEEGDIFEESEVDRHVARLFLQDFQQCGIHLPESGRRQVVELNDRALRLGQTFSARCHAPRAVRAEVLPPQVRRQFHVEADGSIVVAGQHIDSPDDLAREAAYKIYYSRDAEQEGVLAELLAARHQLAQLCGYRTFGHRALTNSLAQSPENTAAFLGHLAAELPSRVADDHQHMLALKRRVNPLCGDLAVWDVPYFSAQARAGMFHLDLEKICEYFSLGVAMEGLNELFQALYGVELVVETARPGELWSDDVFKLAVKSAEVGLLGHIYCDFFTRPGKPHQDCHFTIRGGRERADGSYQDPIVVLMLNLSSPGWRSPTLLSPSTLDNLFHEMGHAMHSMLGRTKYQHVTGTRCSTDFAEVPSTLMEYFAADPRVLSRVNRHYRTGEKLPEATVQMLCATKKVFAGTELQAQLFYSAVDQAFHSTEALPGDTVACLQEVQEQFHTLAHPPSTAHHLRFSHLVGYGARYYSYLLARAVASAIWQHGFQDDPYCGAAGRRYWSECLAHGGGKPSHLLVADHLHQQEFQPRALAASLLRELDTKKVEVEEALRSGR